MYQQIIRLPALCREHPAMCLDLGGKGKATKKSILVAVFLWVKKLPKYSARIQFASATGGLIPKST